MRKVKEKRTEMHNVSFIDKPHAISKLIRSGFSIGDIHIVRISPSNYDITAVKTL